MHRRHRKKLPGLWLITDERVPDDALLAAAARLLRGQAGIIFRHYRTEARAGRELFEALRVIARRRRLVLLLAGDRRDAAAWKADGWHGRAHLGRGWEPLRRSMIRSVPAHDGREIVTARRAGADMLLLSPLFPTRSHPGAPALGRVRFAALARQADCAVMALGGVKAEHRKMLRGIGADGWAAIDGLVLV
ncbi:thiamine phosphate synthase [Sphingobium lactosutens]|uniref:thiamine phosphate synthase n=1 Tax=Sphingobium lactosutens TaxID=522773 RepID=UPI0015BBD93E|nr:thiamine phosphate synthase [Sphingobium lactosutens]